MVNQTAHHVHVAGERGIVHVDRHACMTRGCVLFSSVTAHSFHMNARTCTSRRTGSYNHHATMQQTATCKAYLFDLTNCVGDDERLRLPLDGVVINIEVDKAHISHLDVRLLTLNP